MIGQSGHSGIHSVLMKAGEKGWFPFTSDYLFLKYKYKERFGKHLDLKNPTTFNEKLQWLKLYDRRMEYSTLVDKYEVKEIVGKKIGYEHIIPTIGVWDRFEDIDFERLPDKFVLKCTHDSGGLVICENKKDFDMQAARRRISKSLSTNFYHVGREWPYKYVKPRIIAEKYMENEEGDHELTDYKLHFFSGDCKAIMVGQHRFSKEGFTNDFFSPEWEHLDLRRGDSPNSRSVINRPSQLESLISLGKILAADYPFVRVDFYVIHGAIFFGEITFYPSSGFRAFHPDKWDRVFGDWVKLPPKKSSH